jgi:hypothetical protein
MSDEQLADELRAIGRSAAVPPVADGLATAVLERVADLPVRRTFAQVVRGRWRALLAAFLVVLGGSVLVEPVRATVADWFGLGGVVVQQVPSGPTTAPQPPAASGLSLAEAGRQARFIPVVPAELGTPDGVDVSADKRIVAMSWQTSGGTVRLEQFLGQVSTMYIKRISNQVEFLQVDGRDALWFKSPHELVYVDKRGIEHTAQARAAGPTLVWQYDDLTFRLEGIPDKTRAAAIATSTVRR